MLPGAVRHEQFRGVLYVGSRFPLYFLLSSVPKWKSHAKNVDITSENQGKNVISIWNAHNNCTAYTAWGDVMERLCAEILEVNPDSLLVRSRNRQEILVKTNCTCGYARHDRVHILYDGIMTRSIPPQIQAVRITRAKFNRCPR